MHPIEEAIKYLQRDLTVGNLQKARERVVVANILPTDIDIAINALIKGDTATAKEFIYGPTKRGTGLGAIQDLKNILNRV